jgi:polyphosphate kinase 2 (PPK2 family)
LLIVLQAMDTGGKDGAIKHVFRGVNPQGCRVWSFKKWFRNLTIADTLEAMAPQFPPAEQGLDQIAVPD